MKMNLAPIELSFVDLKTNRTVVLEGHIDPMDFPAFNDLNLSTTTTKPHILEGSTGPMLYVLAVILVYGLSMFLIVGTLARKKSYHKQLDVEVGRYVKGLERARQEAKQDQVKMTILRWPGNFVKSPEEDENNSDYNSADSDDFIEYSATTAPPYLHTGESTSDVRDESSDESSSYTELPATTVIYVDEATSSSEDNESDQSYELSRNASQQNMDLLMVPQKLPRMKTHIPHPRNMSVQFMEIPQDRLLNSDFLISEAKFLSNDALSLKSASNVEVNVGNGKATDDNYKEQSSSLEHLTKHRRKRHLKTKSTKHGHSLDNDDSSATDDYNTPKNKRKDRNSKNEDSSATDDYNTPKNKRKRKSGLFKHSHRHSNSSFGSTEKKIHRFPFLHNFAHRHTHQKSEESAESVNDMDVLEEYRNSQLYKMRSSRGKKTNVLLSQELNNNPENTISSAISSPSLTTGSSERLNTPRTPIRPIRISTVSSPLAHRPFRISTALSPQTQPVISDNSDAEDPLLEKYRNSKIYKVRSSRGRRINALVSEEWNNILENRISSALSSPLLETGSTPKLYTPQTIKRPVRISTMSSPLSHNINVASDHSDVEDPVLEKYKHTAGYQSRTRGRRGALL